MYRSKVRLHLARDGKTVVKPGDPRSASLLVAAGGELSDEEARRYGLLDGGQQEEALSLDTTSTSQQPPLTSSIVSNPQDVSPFPQQMNFGGAHVNQSRQGKTQQNEQQPPPWQEQQPPPPGAVELPGQPADSNVLHPPHEEMTPLPDSFPHRSILSGQGYETVEKVMALSREQLIGLNQIGSGRADEIISAREQLKTT